VIEYARRRLIRIIPLFLFSLVVAVAVGAITHTLDDAAFSARNLIGNLVFLVEAPTGSGHWFVPYGNNGPLWSLSFEMFFYLSFPVSVLLERRFNVRSPAAALAGTYAMSAAALAVHQVYPSPISIFVSLYCIWRLGAAAFDLLQSDADRSRVLLVAVGVAVVLTIFLQWRSSATLSHIRDGTVIGLIWIGLQSLSTVRRLADRRSVRACIAPFASLGAISYALYILHYPILRIAVEGFGDSIGVVVGATVVCVMLARAAQAGASRIQKALVRTPSPAVPEAPALQAA
jgi:peptidoglycan/LPS O-acetylase OafA/YrhL